MGDIYADGGTSTYPTALDTRTAQVDASPSLPFSTSSSHVSKINEVADAVIAVQTAIGISTTYGPGYGVVGANCANNTSTPNTQYDLDADFILLRPATYGTNNPVSVLSMNPGAALTVNILTAGPAANGRDQAGAFTASTFVHFYWIWNGTAIATLSSATAPPTGPTMPTGYTHWAYAGAVRFNGSSVLLRSRIRGGWTLYDDFTGDLLVLNAGTATSETSVNLSSAIPANALALQLFMDFRISTGSTAAGTAYVLTRVLTGVDCNSMLIFKNNATDEGAVQASAIFPNVGQAVLYVIAEANAADTTDYTLRVSGHLNPNGGE